MVQFQSHFSFWFFSPDLKVYLPIYYFIISELTFRRQPLLKTSPFPSFALARLWSPTLKTSSRIIPSHPCILWSGTEVFLWFTSGTTLSATCILSRWGLLSVTLGSRWWEKWSFLLIGGPGFETRWEFRYWLCFSDGRR